MSPNVNELEDAVGLEGDKTTLENLEEATKEQIRHKAKHRAQPFKSNQLLKKLLKGQPNK